MSVNTLNVLKLIGKYYNVPLGAVCYKTDKAPTAVIDNQNVDGFASIILQLSNKSGLQMNQEHILLSYQWLEYISMYGNQALSNSAFSKHFLQDINKALQKRSFLTGQHLTVVDIAAYYVLYPFLERMSIAEREKLMHVCRWSRHVQAQPKVCETQPLLPLDTLLLSVTSPAVH